MNEDLRFLDAGDCALVVQFGETIDEAVNERVRALDAAIRHAAPPGLRETVPTYRSLLVNFDPVLVRRRDLQEAILALADHAMDGDRAPHRLWLVPVLYGGEAGEDLEAVAAVNDLTPAEVVALHSAPEYRVYMIGFAPGFAYLGGLPKPIHTSRRSVPRLKTPPRSISIGGGQTAVSPPLELPSGWHLLGRTPVRSYDPRRVDRPFLFESGDRIRFVPIDASDYDGLCEAADAGDIVAKEQEG